MSIEEKFAAAVDIINNLPSDGTFQPSEDLMLKLNAFYKQATEGPCNMPQPSVWYFASRVEWNAWNELDNMPKEVAMEKYIEELTKVIETMSYNETVSRFMSLIGPFYEIVSTDEVDKEPVKKTASKTSTEFPYPVTNLADLPTLKDEISQVDLSITSSSEESLECFPNSPMKRTSSAGVYSGPSSRKLTLNTFKQKSSVFKSRTLLSKQDLLMLTLINLKTSMEDIVKKFDNLHNLAKSANFKNESETDDQAKDWDLGVGVTVFGLLWPIAVHFWSTNF